MSETVKAYKRIRQEMDEAFDGLREDIERAMRGHDDPFEPVTLLTYGEGDDAVHLKYFFGDELPYTVTDADGNELEAEETLLAGLGALYAEFWH